MITHNTDALKIEIARHAADDGALLAFGQYFNPKTGAACFIGCAAKSADLAVTVRLYGIPEPVQRIGEAIHEGFGRDRKAEAVAFFAEFGKALCDGMDLSKFHWEYMHETLLAIPAHGPRVDACVAESAAIMRLLADGADPAGLQDRAEAAARAAAAAAVARAAAARAWAKAARTAAEAARARAAAKAVWVAFEQEEAEAVWAEAAWAAAEAAEAAEAAVAEAEAEVAVARTAAKAETAGPSNSWPIQAERFIRLLRQCRPDAEVGK